jgi:hypothetical protein
MMIFAVNATTTVPFLHVELLLRVVTTQNGLSSGFCKNRFRQNEK